jgi:hypothetical protein
VIALHRRHCAPRIFGFPWESRDPPEFAGSSSIEGKRRCSKATLTLPDLGSKREKRLISAKNGFIHRFRRRRIPPYRTQ